MSLINLDRVLDDTRPHNYGEGLSLSQIQGVRCILNHRPTREHRRDCDGHCTSLQPTDPSSWCPFEPSYLLAETGGGKSLIIVTAVLALTQKKGQKVLVLAPNGVVRDNLLRYLSPNHDPTGEKQALMARVLQCHPDKLRKFLKSYVEVFQSNKSTASTLYNMGTARIIFISPQQWNCYKKGNEELREQMFNKICRGAQYAFFDECDTFRDLRSGAISPVFGQSFAQFAKAMELGAFGLTATEIPDIEPLLRLPMAVPRVVCHPLRFFYDDEDERKQPLKTKREAWDHVRLMPEPNALAMVESIGELSYLIEKAQFPLKAILFLNGQDQTLQLFCHTLNAQLTARKIMNPLRGKPLKAVVYHSDIPTDLDALERDPANYFDIVINDSKLTKGVDLPFLKVGFLVKCTDHPDTLKQMMGRLRRFLPVHPGYPGYTSDMNRQIAHLYFLEHHRSSLQTLAGASNGAIQFADSMRAFYGDEKVKEEDSPTEDDETEDEDEQELAIVEEEESKAVPMEITVVPPEDPPINIPIPSVKNEEEEPEAIPLDFGFLARKAATQARINIKQTASKGGNKKKRRKVAVAGKKEEKEEESDYKTESESDDDDDEEEESAYDPESSSDDSDEDDEDDEEEESEDEGKTERLKVSSIGLKGKKRGRIGSGRRAGLTLAQQEHFNQLIERPPTCPDCGKKLDVVGKNNRFDAYITRANRKRLHLQQRRPPEYAQGEYVVGAPGSDHMASVMNCTFCLEQQRRQVIAMVEGRECAQGNRCLRIQACPRDPRPALLCVKNGEAKCVPKEVRTNPTERERLGYSLTSVKLVSKRWECDRICEWCKGLKGRRTGIYGSDPNTARVGEDMIHGYSAVRQHMQHAGVFDHESRAAEARRLDDHTISLLQRLHPEPLSEEVKEILTSGYRQNVMNMDVCERPPDAIEDMNLQAIMKEWNENPEPIECLITALKSGIDLTLDELELKHGWQPDWDLERFTHYEPCKLIEIHPDGRLTPHPPVWNRLCRWLRARKEGHGEYFANPEAEVRDRLNPDSPHLISRFLQLAVLRFGDQPRPSSAWYSLAREVGMSKFSPDKLRTEGSGAWAHTFDYVEKTAHKMYVLSHHFF